MNIAWYGHAAFRLRSREAVVFTDPCPPGTGFKLNRPGADIVTISSADPNHSFREGVEVEAGGLEQPLDAPGEYEIKRVLVTGVPTPGPEGDDGKRTRNVAFVITIDDVIIAHLGDLRDMPERAALEELQRADVCLLPIGGGAHLSPGAAASVANAIAAPIVVPMIYQPDGGEAPATGLEPLAPFLSEMGLSAEPPTDNNVNVTAGGIPPSITVVPLLARGA